MVPYSTTGNNRSTMKNVTPFFMSYFFKRYSDGLLWAVEDDSAALLTKQSEFLQMVINEVQHGVH